MKGQGTLEMFFLLVNQSLLYNKKSNTVHNNNIQRLNEENVNTENNENFVWNKFKN